MGDYKKIEKTHFLSAYEVKVPNWSGAKSTWSPFSPWASGSSLDWYNAYNTTKHDRHSQFDQATFEQLIAACCGLLVLLSSQFETNDFSPGDMLLSLGGPGDGMESGIGDYFRVRFPDNWPNELRYDFNWQTLESEPDPFREIDYATIT